MSVIILRRIGNETSRQEESSEWLCFVLSAVVLLECPAIKIVAVKIHLFFCDFFSDGFFDITPVVTCRTVVAILLVPLVNSNDSIVPSKVFLLPCFNSVNTCYHYEMKVIRDTDHRRLGYTNTAATAVFSGIAIPLQRNKKNKKVPFLVWVVLWVHCSFPKSPCFVIP